MEPKMPIYILQPRKEKLVTQPQSTSGVERRVWVEGGDWFGARAQALQHAIDNGARTVAVMCSDVQLFRRPHGGDLVLQGTNDSHGMWLYLERLCKRYGHVYVPPTAWAAQHPAWGSLLTPTIPLVTAYQVKALQSLSELHSSIGFDLCSNGYDSYTVGDYFYQGMAVREQRLALDEHGSTASWTRAYLQAIERTIA